MEVICVDDEYFDPYYILGVTNDDTDEHITRAFRLKAKKYHPDKAPSHKLKDYIRKFKIVKESYDYICSKRANNIHIINKDNYGNDNPKNHKIKTKFEESNVNLNDNHKDPIIRHIEAEEILRYNLPTDFGYGEHSRLSKIEDYENFNIPTIKKIFTKKKFNNKDFNRVFDYINDQNEEDDNKNNNISIVDKTTDGFIGYNTSDLGNCSNVSSYKGLLMIGDNYGESGIGYWGNNYADYKMSYRNKLKNNQDIDLKEIPKDYIANKLKNLKIKKVKNSKYEHVKIKDSNYSDAKKELYNKALSELLEKEERDKEIIMKYSHRFPKEMLQNALEDRLETTPDLINMLNKHYKVKRLE
jgi:curved DNA-binding protein CbpA